MMFQTLIADTNKTAMTLMQAGMDSVKHTQETMKRQREIAARMEFPWQIDWSDDKVPMPKVTYKASSADTTREAFHLMADANMKAWETAAEAWAAVPGWAKIPYTAPGEFWAKWFDQWQDGKFDGASASHVEAMVDTMTTAVEEAQNTAKQTGAAFGSQTTELAEKVIDETEKNVKTATKVAEDTADLFKPELLDVPKKGEMDDLTQIKGIGEKLSQTLNDVGVWSFAQIAAWTPENIGWLDEKLAFKGRISREAWVEQARELLNKAAT
tara:strand:+ start:3457 stop:4263 length:807 start_codon:yes stop_codon:yes gene_type:complete